MAYSSYMLEIYVLGNLACFFVVVVCYFLSFRVIIVINGMSYSLDPDQDNVGPDLSRGGGVIGPLFHQMAPW